MPQIIQLHQISKKNIPFLHYNMNIRKRNTQQRFHKDQNIPTSINTHKPSPNLVYQNTIYQKQITHSQNYHSNQFVKGMTLDAYFLKTLIPDSQQNNSEEQLAVHKNTQILEMEEQNYSESHDQSNHQIIKIIKPLHQQSTQRTFTQHPFNKQLSLQTKFIKNKNLFLSESKPTLPCLNTQDKLKTVKTLYGINFRKPKKNSNIKQNGINFIQIKSSNHWKQLMPLTSNRYKDNNFFKNQPIQLKKNNLLSPKQQKLLVMQSKKCMVSTRTPKIFI